VKLEIGQSAFRLCGEL